MDKIYFTITGTSYRYGTELFEKGDWVMLKKEPDNKWVFTFSSGMDFLHGE